MKSLLDNNNCASTGIIEPIWDNFRKPHIGIGANRLRFHQHGVIGVVYDESIAPLAYTNTSNRCGQLPARLIVSKFDLGELLVGNLETITPETLISLINHHFQAT